MMNCEENKSKKTMKNILFMMLVLILSFSFTACNKAENNNNEAVSDSEAITQGTQETKGTQGQNNVAVSQTKKHQYKPIIYGAENKTFYVNDTVSYMSGVYAKDDTDQEIDVEVDKSEVDTTKPGEYTVHYKAVDSDGNEANVDVVFSFIEKVEQTEPQIQSGQENQSVDSMNLEQILNKVLGEITNSSMSMGEKAKAIFSYTHGKIYYTTNPIDGNDYPNEALQAMKSIESQGYVWGDCFTYYAVARVLLEGIGAKCIRLDNKGALTGEHVWILCDLGTGYYHFDATRMRDGFETFMLTDDEIEAYLATGKSIYWRDKTLYPETPSVSFSY